LGPLRSGPVLTVTVWRFSPKVNRRALWSGRLVSRSMSAMAIDIQNLSIRTFPDPCLRQKAESIDPSSEEVQQVAARMIELMHQANGAGLAAPQVGLAWRLFVTRDPESDDGGLVWANPVLTPVESPPETDTEGCLSLPGIEVEVSRPSRVRISCESPSGERFEVESELLARVWQHEADHLDGVLIIDKMSTMERIKNRRQIKALKKASSS